MVLDTGTAFESSLGTLSVPVGTILAGTGVGTGTSQHFGAKWLAPKCWDVPVPVGRIPAIFSIPAPVPAKTVPGTGYLSRIVLGPFCT